MLLIAVLAFTYLSVPSPAQAAPPAGYDVLPSRQKDLFDAVAKQEFCGCDSALTLQKCLGDRPKCGLAQTLGQVLLKATQLGASQSQLAGFMSQAVLGPYCAPPVAIDVGDAPARGPAGAAVQVIEFYDYRCTHCRQAMPFIEAGMKSAPGKARLVLVPLALMPNSPSQVAGEAALAADAQGKFWQMHQALFAQEETQFTHAGVRATAKKLGLNMAKFEAALASPSPKKRLARYREQFIQLGLDGTPATYIDGRRFDLEPNIFDLASRLTLEAQRGDSECS